MASEGDESSAAEGETAVDHGGRPCPMCGEPLYKRHCKYVCEQHGVVYDCSDPFN
ncbi:HVO_2523 family zinc finger protein [Haloarchaeobius sp. DYHT-AS-18]|uniref:HVO_2523 family zinc finger protein n=1 Tax=Haloarchaeobius sp. DYHT-AS-18 TaxID=3446117 RepID=UPI003EBF78AD